MVEHELPPPCATGSNSFVKLIPWMKGYGSPSDGFTNVRYEKRLKHLLEHPTALALLKNNRIEASDLAILTSLCGRLLDPTHILLIVLRLLGYTSPMQLAVEMNITEKAASEYMRRIRKNA